MSRGKVEIICGECTGKTSLAIGKGIMELNAGRTVIMIQFLKGSRKKEEQDVMQRLEPEFKIFRFEKTEAYYENLSGEEKQEELINIRNGLNFTKKVMATGECDVLILDEILGIVDHGIMTAEEFKALLEMREEIDIIATGKVFPKELRECADKVNEICNL